MVVRGAPAIGAAGAFAMVLASQQSSASTIDVFVADMEEAKKLLDDARPTAVNLMWVSRHSWHGAHTCFLVFASACLFL